MAANYQITQITNNTVNDTNPQISGSNIVWVGGDDNLGSSTSTETFKLLGVSYDNYLYDLDFQTGLASNPRYTIQIPLIDITQALDGTLYGITQSGINTPPNAFANSLYQINPNTGEANYIAPTVIPVTEGDLDFDPTTGVMYGVLQATVFPTLLSINTTNGLTTTIGTIGNQFRDISGIAFDSNGNLYALDNYNNELLQIDKSSGEVLNSISIITPTGTQINLGSTVGMDFNPATGELFVADGDSVPGFGTNALYTLNITSGVLSLIGDLGLARGLSGIEFVWTDTPNPQNTISIAKTTDGSETGSVASVFTLTRTGSTASAITVNYTLGGSATLDSDYTNPSGGIATFAAGSATATITLPTINDTVVDPGETIITTITAPTGYTISGSNSATATISDNDSSPTPSNDNFANQSTLNGSTVNTTGTNIGATGETGEPLHGSANAIPLNSVWWNWTAPSAGSVTINTAGSNFDTTLGVYTGTSLSTLITVASNDDSGGNTSSVTFNTVAGTNYKIAVDGYGSNTGNINLGLSFTPTTPSILSIAKTTDGSETGSVASVFTLTRTGSTASAITVNYTLGGTATLDSDYTNPSGGTVSFAAGASTATITLPTIDDTVVDLGETIITTITAPTGYTISGSNSATATISDNDNIGGKVKLNLSANQTIVEGLTNPQSLTYTVSLSSASTQTVTVKYATANGTALAGADYITKKGTLTFAPGVTSQVINIPILNDSLNEPNETFTLKLSKPVNAKLGNAKTATTTITDVLTAAVTTKLPIHVENLLLTGSSSINGTGNKNNNGLIGNSGDNRLKGGLGNDILIDDEGNDALIGGKGNDILIDGHGNNTFLGGRGSDILIGGADKDQFTYKNLTDSLLANFDAITDFNANNDLFLVSYKPFQFVNVGAVAKLNAAKISKKLTPANFGAKNAAQFTFTSESTTQTFVAINDTTAGFNAATDAIVEVTGLKGSLSISNFTNFDFNGWG